MLIIKMCRYHLLANDSDWAGSHSTAWGREVKAWRPGKKKTDDELSLSNKSAAADVSTVYLVVDPAVARAAGAHVVFGPVNTSTQPLFGQDRPWEAAWLNTNPTAALDPQTSAVKLWYNTLTSCPPGMFSVPGMCVSAGYPPCLSSCVVKTALSNTGAFEDNPQCVFQKCSSI